MAVLPIYNVITVPDSNIYLKTDYYQRMTGKAPAVDDKITIVILKEELSRTEFSAESFYDVGITGSVIEVNENGYIVIHLKNRITITQKLFHKNQKEQNTSII